MNKERTARSEAIEIAEDYGVDPVSAGCIFDLLGPSELHDGYICALEDFAQSY